MKKRITAALLSLVLMLSLAACGTSDQGEVKDNADTTAADTTAPEEELLPAGIEEQNYEGTVNILMPDWGLYLNYFDPGEDRTDIMNKALHNRELKVEEYLGVDITYEHLKEGISMISSRLNSAIATNDDLYQIVLAHCIHSNLEMITNGYLVDMNEMDIDFDNDWFNVGANEALSVQEKQFFCVSDYNIPDPNMFLFNKEMIEELQLEDPYQLVRDGKWTLDKLSEMASVATADNGDSVWDVNDTYGFSCPDNWFTNSFIFAADTPFIEKNEDGDFCFAFDNERSYTLMEKLDALFNGPDAYVFNYNGLYGNANYTAEALPIESERCLFTVHTFNMLHTIRDVETEFGILPFPKLDEAQENYISNDWTGLTAVPMSVNEASYGMVGDVIELLAYYSEDVISTYIDVTLGTKLSRDTESKEMINLIFDTCSFNAGMNYFGFSYGADNLFYSVDRMIIKKGENMLASYIASNAPPAELAIERFNRDVRELGN